MVRLTGALQRTKSVVAIGKNCFLGTGLGLDRLQPLSPSGTRSWSRWGVSSAIFVSSIMVLKVYRSWSNARLQPITYSALWILHCSLHLSSEADSDGRREDGLNCGGVEVHHHPLLGFLQLPLKIFGNDGDILVNFILYMQLSTCQKIRLIMGWRVKAVVDPWLSEWHYCLKHITGITALLHLFLFYVQGMFHFSSH